MANADERRVTNYRSLSMIVGVSLTLVVAVGFVAINVAFYAGFLADEQHCTDGTTVHDTAHIIRAEKADFWAAAKRTYADPKRDPLNQFGLLPRPVEVIGISGKTASLRVASDILPGNTSYAQVWLPIFQKYHPKLREWCAAVVVSTPAETVTQTFGNGPYL